MILYSLYGPGSCMVLHCHVGDFPQPQQKYAGTGENGNLFENDCAYYLAVKAKALRYQI